MLSLAVDRLSKTYPNGTVALNRVSFSAQPGEGIVLLGSNGSGKSTLLRCIVGLEKPTSGRIGVGNSQLETANACQLRQLRQQIGIVFQRFHLVANLSAFHNVLQGSLGRSKGPRYWFPATAPKQERDRVMQCLERVNLAHLAQQRVDTLSGGQQQRVAIARMLMQDTSLLLVDEPVASLDPKSGREAMDLLWDIVRERQLTAICTLHQLDLAKDYADRIIGLRQGEIQIDAPAHILTDRELSWLYESSPISNAVESNA
ncbi:phosphonate ABC transporter, ATP-binding protein [Rubidibacter lacunae KORDI 51-2]|uniref:Phosphonate ABC transporter, ATP-binding protein n=1 Tax=Rubidibacter lacunae KORDI 51-2 TaxID=582515 RepID=U5DD66_9CHRO|nr:phosphonate ABC transporter ATP-binding protein [Rubidibacter lacunae]ERN42458.1 phosphonate ABC transporter, ATP-binding protein [Rubidibacter lacunae KORDI 51-2]